MSDKKLLVVFGATGNQGGSVINSILGDPNAAAIYKIRGITRDISKPAAQALIKRGVEVATGDFDDKESLKKALEGAHSVFSVTNFLDHFDHERETKQAINVAEVAAEVGVHHFIYSSLSNITKLSKGRYTLIKYFDSKAIAEEYIRANLPHLPSTFFLAGFYMTNLSRIFTDCMFPYDPEIKTYHIQFPFDTNKPAIPIFDAERDTGKWVKAILLKREETLGKQVLGATKYATLEEIAEGFNKIRGHEGVKAAARFLPKEEWRLNVSEAMRDGITENAEMLGVTGSFGGEPLEWSLSILDEQPTTWEKFVAVEKEWLHLK